MFLIHQHAHVMSEKIGYLKKIKCMCNMFCCCRLTFCGPLFIFCFYTWSIFSQSAWTDIINTIFTSFVFVLFLNRRFITHNELLFPLLLHQNNILPTVGQFRPSSVSVSRVQALNSDATAFTAQPFFS